jgi:hypothetical protein
MNRYRDKAIVRLNAIRAAKFGATGSFTVEEWLGLCAQYEHKCAECHAQAPLTADHIIPLTRGGTNDIDNIQPLCRPCNSRKSNKVDGKRPERPAKIVPLPVEYSQNWGGARKGSGRLPRNIKISPEASRELNILFKEHKALNPAITESQIVSDLIHAAWQELDQDIIRHSLDAAQL